MASSTFAVEVPVTCTFVLAVMPVSIELSGRDMAYHPPILTLSLATSSQTTILMIVRRREASDLWQSFDAG